MSVRSSWSCLNFLYCYWFFWLLLLPQLIISVVVFFPSSFTFFLFCIVSIAVSSSSMLFFLPYLICWVILLTVFFISDTLIFISWYSICVSLYLPCLYKDFQSFIYRLNICNIIVITILMSFSINFGICLIFGSVLVDQFFLLMDDIFQFFVYPVIF